MAEKKIQKRWLIYCEPCSFRSTIMEEEIKGFTEVPLVDTPGGHPKRNPETKKVETPKSLPRAKMFKCPQCGRGVIAKPLPDIYVKTIEDVEKEKLKKQDAERKKVQEERRIKEEEFINEKKDRST